MRAKKLEVKDGKIFHNGEQVSPTEAAYILAKKGIFLSDWAVKERIRLGVPLTKPNRKKCVVDFFGEEMSYMEAWERAKRKGCTVGYNPFVLRIKRGLKGDELISPKRVTRPRKYL